MFDATAVTPIAKPPDLACRPLHCERHLASGRIPACWIDSAFVSGEYSGWNIQIGSIVLTPLAIAVLALLREGPMHRYEMPSSCGSGISTRSSRSRSAPCTTRSTGWSVTDSSSRWAPARRQPPGTDDLSGHRSRRGGRSSLGSRPPCASRSGNTRRIRTR